MSNFIAEYANGIGGRAVYQDEILFIDETTGDFVVTDLFFNVKSDFASPPNIAGFTDSAGLVLNYTTNELSFISPAGVVTLFFTPPADYGTGIGSIGVVNNIIYALYRDLNNNYYLYLFDKNGNILEVLSLDTGIGATFAYFYFYTSGSLCFSCQNYPVTGTNALFFYTNGALENSILSTNDPNVEYINTNFAILVYIEKVPFLSIMSNATGNNTLVFYSLAGLLQDRNILIGNNNTLNVNTSFSNYLLCYDNTAFNPFIVDLLLGIIIIPGFGPFQNLIVPPVFAAVQSNILYIYGTSPTLYGPAYNLRFSGFSLPENRVYSSRHFAHNYSRGVPINQGTQNLILPPNRNIIL